MFNSLALRCSGGPFKDVTRSIGGSTRATPIERWLKRGNVAALRHTFTLCAFASSVPDST
jgi:hypothetical protein